MSLANLPFALPEPLLRTLREAYADPPRAYHNFSHVEEVLMHYGSVPHWDDPVSVALAVLFHDAVYRAGQTDNEAESARLARHTLASCPLEVAFDGSRVEALILLTARHGSLSPAQVDHDAAQLLDCDMAILGAPHARFERYEAAIAEEYAQLPRDVYRAGRARFLRKLLDSPTIYLSPLFEQRLEQTARSNLQRALAAL